jgi:hypothetical protein
MVSSRQVLFVVQHFYRWGPAQHAPNTASLSQLGRASKKTEKFLGNTLKFPKALP